MNTNETQEKAKTGVIKTLAIIGFISIVVLAVWLAVQAIRVAPTAFSSLASVLDSIEANRPIDTLTVTTEKSIVNIGESVKVSWSNLKRDGTYSFYYTCTEGVSVEIRTTEGDASTIACENAVILPSGSQSLDMIVSSERRRFVDIPFTIAFTATDETEPLFERNNKMTVVNATIPQSVEVAIENGDEDEEVEEQPDVAPENTDTPPASQNTGSTVTGGSQSATVVHQTLSFIPQSFENGFTDLKINYLGVGTIEGSTFTPAAAIDSSDRGAIRFEVKNIGTKTSDEWTFSATLPTGYVFESEKQTGLKPNEKAVYTLGFDAIGASAGVRTIKASLDVDEDTNSANDSFSWSVLIID